MLYRQLLPSLRNHQAILLLTEMPKQLLVDAVRQLGILIETYKRAGQEGKEISFSSSFLLEFRVWLAVFRQRSLFDRAVCSLRRPLEAGLRDVQAAAALRGGPVP